MVPEKLLEFSEGLGEVLQLVVEVDVLLDQGVDGVLQLEAPSPQHQQEQGQ